VRICAAVHAGNHAAVSTRDSKINLTFPAIISSKLIIAILPSSKLIIAIFPNLPKIIAIYCNYFQYISPKKLIAILAIMAIFAMIAIT